MRQLQTINQAVVRQDESAFAEPRTWFAAFTRSHHEKSVERHLEGRGIQCFLPRYQAVHSWSHQRKAKLDLPLFPNYLFVRISRQEQSRVLGVSGLIGLVGAGNRPAALAEEEIEHLRSSLQQRAVEPHTYVAVGERARIATGPLAGMEGVIVRNKSGLRMVLKIDLIMQGAAVEVSADELVPVGPVRVN